jgi:hypothetical protein
LFGLGGMTWQGRAWRLKIPKLLILFGHHEANNVLEYLAMVTSFGTCTSRSLMEESRVLG